MSYPQRCILAAVTLFFIAPLVAEYLLGDFAITFLSPLIIMAPMYGGGALLIRELARHTGRGWPTILLLGCAYCHIEEAFTTQTLFNPNIFGMHMHLLSHAWIPALGIGAWWTLFMLNVHPFWSIGVSIALVEGLFPSHARTPWLGKVGLSVAAVLFAVGIYANTSYSFHHDPFRASHTQFLVSAIARRRIRRCRLPHSRPDSVPQQQSQSRTLPMAHRQPLHSFSARPSSLAPIFWNWGAVAVDLRRRSRVSVSLRMFSRRDGWTPLHTLSVGAGGALVYGMHAFLQGPVVPSPKWVVLTSHVLLLVLALAVITLAALRTRSTLRAGSLQPISADSH